MILRFSDFDTQPNSRFIFSFNLMLPNIVKSNARFTLLYNMELRELKKLQNQAARVLTTQGYDSDLMTFVSVLTIYVGGGGRE